MLARCGANRARDISRLSARQQQSSLITVVLSGGLKPLAGCSNEIYSGSHTVIRSFSAGIEPTRGSRQMHRGNDQHAQQRVARKESPSVWKSIQNKSPKPVVSLSEASQHDNFLAQKLSLLESLPPVWSTAPVPIDSIDVREAVFDEAQMLLDRIENAVNTQQLNPSGKHGRELSHLLGQILDIYSQVAVPSESETSIFDACCRVMTVLQEWNLDKQPHNYACAVEVAARESRWNEASYLFWEQIDPDAHGHTPMEISR